MLQAIPNTEGHSTIWARKRLIFNSTRRWRTRIPKEILHRRPFSLKRSPTLILAVIRCKIPFESTNWLKIWARTAWPWSFVSLVRTGTTDHLSLLHAWRTNKKDCLPAWHCTREQNIVINYIVEKLLLYCMRVSANSKTDKWFRCEETKYLERRKIETRLVSYIQMIILIFILISLEVDGWSLAAVDVLESKLPTVHLLMQYAIFRSSWTDYERRECRGLSDGTYDDGSSRTIYLFLFALHTPWTATPSSRTTGCLRQWRWETPPTSDGLPSLFVVSDYWCSTSPSSDGTGTKNLVAHGTATRRVSA